MHITIVTVGSRGDVQPYVALGLGLKHAGHQVQIITDGLFADFIQKAGLDFAPIQADPRKALEEDVRKLGSNPVKVLSWINAQFKPLAIQVTQDVYHACKHTDAVVYSNLAFAAFHVAEAYQLPSLAAFLQPSTPTRYFNSPSGIIVPDWLPFKGLANWWSHRIYNQLFFRMVFNF